MVTLILRLRTNPDSGDIWKIQSGLLSPGLGVLLLSIFVLLKVFLSGLQLLLIRLVTSCPWNDIRSSRIEDFRAECGLKLWNQQMRLVCPCWYYRARFITCFCSFFNIESETSDISIVVCELVSPPKRRCILG